MRLKRLLSVLLCVAMIMGLMVTTSFAETAEERVLSVNASDDSGLNIKKSITDNADSSYDLTMEAYATGEVKTTTKSVPLDIVLVLDVSGSMDDNTTTYSYTALESADYSYNKIANSKTQYYYEYNGQFYPVHADYDWWYGEYYLYFGNHYLTSIGKNTVKDPNTTIYSGVLYTATKTTAEKLASMKTAAKKFISMVADDAATNDVDHNISIVKFAGDKKTTIGNDFYYYSSYNNSQTVIGLTAAKTGADTLNGKIDALKAGGATGVDYGLQLANGLLSGTAADRQKVVIVFTDGEPNHDNGFDTAVAKAAIKEAKTLKGANTKVYTIGLLDSNASNNVKNFLQYVSSNYPNASSMSASGTKAADTFSSIVNDGAALDGVFQQIAEETINSGIKADATTAMADTLSSYFDFKLGEDGKLAKFTAAKVPCTGENTWGTPTDITSSVTVAQDGKDIKVSGFDYNENIVAKTADSWRGNKLVVTFTIVPADDAEWQTGTHYYPTNNTTDSKAGIYTADGTELLVLNESPNAPMTAATVTYQVTGAAPATSSALPEAAVYLAGANVAVASGLTTTETTKDGKTGTWSFDGWDRTDDFAMTAENVVITGTWSFNYTEKTDVSMSKVWNDDDNRDGVRPDSISVQLLDSNNNAIGDAVTVTANDNWAHTWNVLKYNADGNEIAYHVVETSADRNYSASADGMTITNTHEVKTIDELTMTKVWADDDNRDGVRPDSIDVQLLANGEPCGDVVTVEANADGAWVYTWTDLYVNENGEPITYTVEEVNVDENYTASYSTDTLTVTNTHESAVTSKTVTKVWNDADDQDGIRPDSVTVNLMNGDKIVARAVLNADNKWSYTWNDLYVNENGQAINYTVEEVDVAEGYESSVDGMTVTNTHEPAVVTVPVVKDWVGDTEAARPESITVNLLAGGEVVQTIKLTADKQWTGAFENVPVYANGEAIDYDVEEVAVDGYTAAYNVTENGVAIVNTLIPVDPEPTPVDPEPTPVNPDPTPAPVPNTGDSSNMVLYIVLAVMALAGIAVVVLAPAKKHGKHSA